MLYDYVMDLLKVGSWEALNRLYDEGLLTLANLNYASQKGWISEEDALIWAEIVLGC